MNCIVKNQATFRNRAVCPVTEYDATLHSIYDEVSTFSVSKEKEEKINEGDYLFTDGEKRSFFGIITKADLADEAAELRCDHIIKIFNRDIIYQDRQNTTTQGVESYLKEQIDLHFTNQVDEVYRLPFLQVIAETTTISSMNPDAEEGVWNIKSFISKIRRTLNIFTDFEISGDALIVHIHRKPEQTRNLDLSFPGYDVLKETYSSKYAGRITAICEEDRSVTDWYLLTDGTIIRAYQATGRVRGEWLILKVDKAEDIADTVTDEFKKNSHSHKVLFDCLEESASFEFYDSVLVLRDERLYVSYIAAVRVSSDSDRITYQCGELRTTLTESKLGEM